MVWEQGLTSLRTVDILTLSEIDLNAICYCYHSTAAFITPLPFIIPSIPTPPHSYPTWLVHGVLLASLAMHSHSRN